MFFGEYYGNIILTDAQSVCYSNVDDSQHLNGAN